MLQSSAIEAAINGRKGPAMQRRYQHGTLKAEGKRRKQWVGRWREDLITPDGRTKRIRRKEVFGLVGKTTKADAFKALADRVTKVNDRNYKPAVDATFEQFAQEWRKKVLSQRKLSYQASEGSRLDHNLIPKLGKLKIGEITAYDVQSFLSSLNVGAKTKKNLLGLLSTMNETARRWRLTTENWCGGVVLPEWTRPEPRAFTLLEVNRMIEAASEPDRTWLWLLAELGGRLGEVCALRPPDFNLERRVVTIRYSAWRSTHVGSTKSKRPRAFSISPELAQHLQRYMDGLKPDQFLFRRADGSAWQGDHAVRDRLKPLLAKLGIAPGGAHAFRHFNCSWMDAENVPLKVRQERVGHEDGMRMTLGTYTHSASEDHKAVAEKLGHALAPRGLAEMPAATRTTQ
jgi:integrase